MCDSPTETGLYYLRSRYYDPQVGRFINADVLADADRGSAGLNLFAYCLNDPVDNHDNSGMLANWIVGGVIGGLVGGFSAGMRGDNVLAGAAQGAVSGAIAGVAVDASLAVVMGGGTVGIIAASIISGSGGIIGSITGEQVYSLIKDGNTVTCNHDMLRRSALAGSLNVLSLGISSYLKLCDEGSWNPNRNSH